MPLKSRSGAATAIFIGEFNASPLHGLPDYFQRGPSRLSGAGFQLSYRHNPDAGTRCLVGPTACQTQAA